MQICVFFFFFTKVYWENIVSSQNTWLSSPPVILDHIQGHKCPLKCEPGQNCKKVNIWHHENKIKSCEFASQLKNPFENENAHIYEWMSPGFRVLVSDVKNNKNEEINDFCELFLYETKNNIRFWMSGNEFGDFLLWLSFFEQNSLIKVLKWLFWQKFSNKMLVKGSLYKVL